MKAMLVKVVGTILIAVACVGCASPMDRGGAFYNGVMIVQCVAGHGC